MWTLGDIPLLSLDFQTIPYILLGFIPRTFQSLSIEELYLSPQLANLWTEPRALRYTHLTRGIALMAPFAPPPPPRPMYKQHSSVQ